MPKIVRTCAAMLCVAALLTGCAGMGTGPDGQPRSALERSIGECLMTAAATTVLGFLINKKSGAGVGLAAGGALCVVILAVNNEQDKQRIRQNQLAAVSSGRTQSDQYVGSDGDARVIKTSVQPVAMPVTATPGAGLPPGETFVGPCRKSATDITVQGKGNAALDPEIYCRTSAGNWKSTGTASA